MSFCIFRKCILLLVLEKIQRKKTLQCEYLGVKMLICAPQNERQ